VTVGLSIVGKRPPAFSWAFGSFTTEKPTAKPAKTHNREGKTV